MLGISWSRWTVTERRRPRSIRERLDRRWKWADGRHWSAVKRWMCKYRRTYQCILMLKYGSTNGLREYENYDDASEASWLMWFWTVEIAPPHLSLSYVSSGTDSFAMGLLTWEFQTPIQTGSGLRPTRITLPMVYIILSVVAPFSRLGDPLSVQSSYSLGWLSTVVTGCLRF